MDCAGLLGAGNKLEDREFCRKVSEAWGALIGVFAHGSILAQW